MKKVESKYLGMKNNGRPKSNYRGLPLRVAMYYEDLKESIGESIIICEKEI